MSDKKGDELLGDILGEELGEWDKMFDALHEDKGDPEAFALPEGALPVPEEKELLIEAEESGPAARQILADDFELDAPFAESFGKSERPAAENFDVDTFVLGAAGVANPDGALPASQGDPGGKVLSPFIEEESPVFEERASALEELDFGEAAQALGSLLGSGPIELPEADRRDSGPSAKVGARFEALGPEDAALEDFSPQATNVMSDEILSRVTESAAAFFEEAEQSGPTELTLELDDDFYDGIQVETRQEDDPPTPVVAVDPGVSSKVPRTSKGRRVAHTVRREGAEPILGPAEVTAVKPSPIAPEKQFTEDTSVRAVEVPALARRAEGEEEALNFDRPRPARDTSVETDASPAVKSGFGVLRTGPEPAGSEDNGELAIEVDGALDEILQTAEAPPPPTATEPVSAGLIRDLAPELDGVVEAAVEDAISLSTGTLNTGPRLREVDVEPELPAAKFEEQAPALDLSAIAVPAEVELADDDRTEEWANRLVLYERELGLLDEIGPSIRLRIEAARLSEALGDLDTARAHLDEALKLDPRLVPANRALRRIERMLGNWGEVLNQLDKEMAKASPLEARALASYRADLLMASGELDLARVAVGELLDATPTDTRSLLANLELAFVDGRDEEISSTLEALAAALTEPPLRAAIANLQGLLAMQAGDPEKAAQSYSQASELAPGVGVTLAHLAALASLDRPRESAEALAKASEQQGGALGAALTWRELQARMEAGDDAGAQARMHAALERAPSDLLLAQTNVRMQKREGASYVAALQRLAACRADEVLASQSLTRASFLSKPDAACELLQEALRITPLDPVPRRALRRACQESGREGEVLAIDALAATREPDNRLFAFRSALSSSASEDFLGALATLEPLVDSDESRAPEDLLALKLAYRAGDQAKLAASFTRAAASATSVGEAMDAARGKSRALTRRALASKDARDLADAADAWRAIASDSDADRHSATILGMTLASLAGDKEGVEASCVTALGFAADPLQTEQLCIERGGVLLSSAPSQAAERLAEIPADMAGSRGAELHSYALLASGDWSEAAEILEAQGRRDGEGAAADRRAYRAAYLRVQNDGELGLGASALDSIVERRPSFAAAVELLGAGRGELAAPASLSETARPTLEQDDLSSEIRRAEHLAAAGDHNAAAEQFAELMQRNPGDALIEYNYHRLAWQAGASALLAETALSAMRQAEERGDMPAKAMACAELARIDGVLRGDAESSLMLWESASKAAPQNAMYHRILEREYGERGASRTRSEAMRILVGRIAESLEPGREKSGYLCERARLAVALGRDQEAAKADFNAAFAQDPECREALLYLESQASAKGASVELATLEAMTAEYFADDQRARAAFLVRAGETWRSLSERDKALAHFKAAAEHMPGFAPALFAWRDLALDHELWQELAEACLLEAASVDSDPGRAELALLAGVTLMDKTEERLRAADALRQVLIVDTAHREAFVRLRALYAEQERYEDLAQILSMRLEVAEGVLEECELRHALASVLREHIGNPAEALEHFRAILSHRPSDKTAVVGLCEITWQEGMWAEAAEAMMVRARLENDPAVLKEIFSRLGTIYSHHLPEPSWALKSFHKVVSIDPNDSLALRELASLGVQTGDYKLALGACEQLIKQDPPVDEKISYLHRIAQIFLQGFDNPQQAERALRVALDLDFSSDAAFDALIGFYIGRNDLRSARVHIDRVLAAMRAALANDPSQAASYRVIARAMKARVQTGAPESKAVAAAAASLARLLGDTDDLTRDLASSATVACSGLTGAEHDELLFPPEAPSSLLALLSLLGDRLAKHAGIDVRNHGVGRSDRLRKGSDPTASLILEQASDMGVDDVDIYLSKQKSLVLAAEPTNPPSLILGSELVSADRQAELRFFVGRSLKLVRAQLSVPLQLGEDAFGVLLVGILRQFQPEFEPVGIDTQAASAEQQKLRRLIPSSMVQELAPFALGLAGAQFDHKAIYAGFVDAGNRAGLLCAGDAEASLRALMRLKQLKTPQDALKDPEIRSLALFACSEEYARLWAALKTK